MRRLVVILLSFSLLLTSCSAQTESSAGESAQPKETSAAASAPSDEIRFALIGSPRDMNVWLLFDEGGASYADYALRFEYYPRLYHLVPPDFSFQPLAAQGLPSDVIQEGEFYSATVNLRADLNWTDGSPFTADDIAFTVNTALAFDLGFDWRASYPRDILHHAEAVDAHTVKFIFKQKPNISTWQYGALQGRIVQKEFWQPRIANAAELIPPSESSDAIEKARARLALVQYDVNDLTSKLRAVRETGGSSRDLEITLTQRKLELKHAKNNLNKALEEYHSALNSAQQALYNADDTGEPTLGAWMFASKTKSMWVNISNPDLPFEKPNFQRAFYRFFENEKDALAAFQNGEVDFILSPNGLPLDVKGAEINSTSNARFLVFNPSLPQFADPAFHSALSCMIDREELAGNILQNQAAPLEAFIISPQWRNPNINNPCGGIEKSRRVEYSVQLLKDAGYSWSRQPDQNHAGEELISPNGESFPKIVLSAPSKESDTLRYAAANYIAEQALYLGIPFAVKEMRAEDVVYAVYSSQKYDAALIGWRLGEYPSYLCEWFDGENPYLYDKERYASNCRALAGETNLEAARNSLHQLEEDLLTVLPFIPLFTVKRAEVYQNLAYPAFHVLNGWNGLYGAPSYAMPAP